MTPSTIFSSMLVLLLLVFSLHMDETLGAQTEIRKLKETINMRRNLGGNNDYKNSKMWFGHSHSPHCHGYERYENMVTTKSFPFPGDDDDNWPFTCTKCDSWGSGCQSCTYTKQCVSYYGSAPRCSISETCCSIPN